MSYLRFCLTWYLDTACFHVHFWVPTPLFPSGFSVKNFPVKILIPFHWSFVRSCNFTTQNFSIVFHFTQSNSRSMQIPAPLTHHLPATHGCLFDITYFSFVFYPIPESLASLLFLHYPSGNSPQGLWTCSPFCGGMEGGVVVRNERKEGWGVSSPQIPSD